MHFGYQPRTDIFAETFMRSTKSILFLLLCLATPLLWAQDYSTVKDLQSEWQIYKGERYVPFKTNEGEIKTIYFSLEPSKFAGNVLRVASNEPLTIFINGQLFTNRNTRLDLAIDSLRQTFQAPVLLVGIHQEKIRAGGLQTLILSRVTGPGEACNRNANALFLLSGFCNCRNVNLSKRFDCGCSAQSKTSLGLFFDY